MGILANIVANFDASSAVTARGDIDSLTGAVPGAASAMSTLEMATAALANPLVALGAAIAVAVTGMAAMGMAAINAADDLRDMGIGSGTATAELQALQAVAEKSGGSLESLNSGLQFISRGLSKGGEETQKFTKALEYFGVQQLDANGNMKSSEKIAEEVAKAYMETANSASKSAAAADALGNGYKGLIPTYAEIGNKQQELNFLQEVGAITTTELQDASDNYNDTMADMGSIMKGLGNYAAESMVPLLQALASQFVESATNGGILEGVFTSLKVVFSTVIGIGKVLATTFIGVDTIFQAVGKTIGGFAAATVALFKGDFTGAKNIMKDMDTDIKNTANGAGERLKKMWTGIGGETKKAGDEAEKAVKKIDRGTYRSTNEKKEKDKKEKEVKIKVEKTDLEKADEALQGLIDSMKTANAATESGTKLEAALMQIQGTRFAAGSAGLKAEVEMLAKRHDELTQNKALEDAMAGMRSSNDDLIQSLDEELMRRTMTAKAYQEYIDMKAIDAASTAALGKLNANVAGYEERRLEILNETVDAKQRLIDKNAELVASEGDWAVGANQALMDFNAGTQDVAGQARAALTNAFNGAEDALTQMVMTGKMDFKGLAQSIIADLARMAIRALMTKAIMSFMGGGFASGGAVSGGGSVSNTMFAEGGVVSSRKQIPFGNGTAEFAENGPEAIMPLKRLPNGNLGVVSTGGGGSSGVDVGGIYVTVHNSGGGKSDSQADAELAGKIGANIELRMKSLINSELRNQSRPGNQLNPTRVNGAF